MIKAIIFDYFGVISSDEYWNFVKAEREADTVFRSYADQVNLGQIPWNAFLNKIAEATGQSIDDVNSLYNSERINPFIVTLLTELHQRYKIGLITNAHHQFIDRLLTETKLADFFDSVVISSRLHVMKPNPEIFKYALNDLDAKSDEVVYVDDAERHVKAAQDLGIHAILYEDFPQFKADLEQLLNHT